MSEQRSSSREATTRSPTVRGWRDRRASTTRARSGRPRRAASRRRAGARARLRRRRRRGHSPSDSTVTGVDVSPSRSRRTGAVPGATFVHGDLTRSTSSRLVRRGRRVLRLQPRPARPARRAGRRIAAWLARAALPRLVRRQRRRGVDRQVARHAERSSPAGRRTRTAARRRTRASSSISDELVTIQRAGRARRPSSGSWRGDELRFRPRPLRRDPRGREGRRLPLRRLRGRAARRAICILRHDVDLSLDAALRMAELEAEAGARATYFLMTRVGLLQPRLEGGRRARSRGCASSATGSRLHAVYPDATSTSASTRSSPGTTPIPSTCARRSTGAVNVMAGAVVRSRPRTARTRTSTGAPVARTRSSRAGAFPWLQLLTHPEIWAYPGETMGQTMRRCSTRSASGGCSSSRERPDRPLA